MKIYDENKINEYLQGYGRLFVCHRWDNRARCEQYMSGLLHECKSNLERMVERIPESDYEQLQHFISDSPWDGMAVMTAVAEKAYDTLTGAGAEPAELGLTLDESGWEKAGKASVGVSSQYIGQLGKVANGQVGVFATLSNGEQVGVLQGRLYLPQTWVDDQKRCQKAGIPEAEQIYRTKPELAVVILQSLPAKVRYAWVGGDSIYGNSLHLRQHLYAQQQSFVLDIGGEVGVYLTHPQPYIPAAKSQRGRQPTRYVSDTQPLALPAVLAQIPAERWQTLTHRQGTKGALTRQATLLDVYLWQPERETSVEALQLLISCETDGSEIKYSLCYTPQGSMTLETALFRQMQRYWCERSFQDAKAQLGLHQYQVRSWTAWYHHIALTAMSLHFLLHIQKENQAEMPLLSVPDIKLVFAKKLRNNLNSDEGLLHALQQPHRKRQHDIDRCAKVPK